MRKGCGHHLCASRHTERRNAKEGLKERVEELEKWQRLTVGREVRMTELKEEIKKLKEKIKE